MKGNKADDLKKEQEAAWQDLLADEKTATRALLKFSTKPKETIAFFKSKMVPLKIEAEEVKKLITDLGSEDKKIWETAYEKFEYFDPRLAMSLQEVFDQSKPGIERGRLVMVLCDHTHKNLDKLEYKIENINLRKHGEDWYNFFDGQYSWGAECRVDRLGTLYSSKKHWIRLVRALILLEHFANDEAIEILKTMSTGNEKALPTTTAKESLKKLLVVQEKK